jgi:transposase-like protein
MKPVCLKCLSNDVRVSARRTHWDKICSWFGFYPFRCHSCDRRFRVHSSRAARQRLIQQQIYSRAAGAFAGVGKGLW